MSKERDAQGHFLKTHETVARSGRTAGAVSVGDFLLGSATAQVSTLTPATVEVDDIFDVLVQVEGFPDSTVSIVATAATVANVVTLLQAALALLPHPITFTDETTEVEATADNPGQPFYLTTSTTDGGGADTQTLVAADTTANGTAKGAKVTAKGKVNRVTLDATIAPTGAALLVDVVNASQNFLKSEAALGDGNKFDLDESGNMLVNVGDIIYIIVRQKGSGAAGSGVLCEVQAEIPD